MPPRVACADVLTSTGNHRPCGRSAAFSASSTSPGSTVAVIASRSTATMRFKCLLWSITSAAPTVCPHCELPAPRARTGTESSRQIAIAARTSSMLRGTSTPTGSTW